MSDKVLSAGYYTVESIKVYSYTDQSFNENNFYEISALVPRIIVSTSIERDFLSGYLEVFDSTGLLEGNERGIQLRGEERVILTVSDTLQNKVVFDLFCYKIDSVSVTGQNDMLSYKMHFVSYQSFLAGTNRITRSYKSRLVSEIIDNIFQEYYIVDSPIANASESDGKLTFSGNKNIIIQQTDNNIRCTIPNFTPAEAINFLNKRAYSSDKSPSCSFRFFENTRGFYFVSDEAIFDGIASKLPDSTDKAFQMTYYLNLSKNPNPSTLIDQMNNFTSIIAPVHVDTIGDMYGGAYKNKVIVLDIEKGMANLKDPGFTYQSNKYKQTNQQKHTPEFVSNFIRPEIEQRFLLIKDYDEESTNEDSSMPGNFHYDEIISNKLAFRRHLDGVTIEAKGPGRLDITAGDVIDLTASEFNSKNKSAENKKMSGRYIVRSVVHEMNEENMENTYMLSKTGWGDDRRQGPNESIFDKFEAKVSKIKKIGNRLRDIIR